MTCIVGVVNKKDKCVVMGADSASTNGVDIIIRRDTKIFRLSSFVIGCTSSFRMIQLLRFSLKLPEIPKSMDIYEYMCTHFINSVRTCLKDGGFLEEEKGAESIGIFLVGYKDRLFKIEADLQVGESVDGIMACGCGGDYALGAIHSLRLNKSNISPIKEAEHALSVSAKLSSAVARPFKIMTTK